MEEIVIPLDINYPDTLSQNDTIEIRKKFNNLKKKSQKEAKISECYYCKSKIKSFCNSHTVPRVFLNNISEDGKFSYINSIIEAPHVNKTKGMNEAGTFYLLCNNCDGKVFKDYESLENYEQIPTIKMLSQIDMKNNLKNISKRLTEIKLYENISEKSFVDMSEIIKISEVDLEEFKLAYNVAKKRDINPFPNDYYMGFYERLPYTVPIAFQGTIALIKGLDGSVINNVYSKNFNYRIKNMSLCIFPLKNSTIVMIFVDGKNKRYSQFFRKLKKEELKTQLEIINYILFLYCEDYFISPNVSREVLDELKKISSKTSGVITNIPFESDTKIEFAKERFDLNHRIKIPNLLSEKYSIKNLESKENKLEEKN